jgi:hypothetical protein
MCGAESFEPEVELQAFISAVREVYRNESWDRVEGYVERAWHQSGQADHTSWDSVKVRIRAAWE